MEFQVLFALVIVFADLAVAKWINPTVIGPSDRIGFIRPRKTGSTFMMQFFNQAGWCENFCEPYTDSCTDCMFTWKCEDCPEKKTMYAHCKECNHQSLPAIRTKFSNIQQRIILSRGFIGNLYTVMLMRDPVERVLSYFFYVRWACHYKNEPELAQKAGAPLSWLQNRPLEEQNAICDGDFETFVRLTPVHNEQADMLVGISFFNPNISEQHCNTAMLRLDEVSAVVLNEEMDASVKLLHRAFLRPSVAKNSNDQPIRHPNRHVRQTPDDSLREVLRSNQKLMNLLREYNHCDVRLYNRAIEIFSEAKHRYQLD